MNQNKAMLKGYNAGVLCAKLLMGTLSRREPEACCRYLAQKLLDEFHTTTPREFLKRLPGLYEALAVPVPSVLEHYCQHRRSKAGMMFVITFALHLSDWQRGVLSEEEKEVKNHE